MNDENSISDTITIQSCCVTLRCKVHVNIVWCLKNVSIRSLNHLLTKCLEINTIRTTEDVRRDRECVECRHLPKWLSVRRCIEHFLFVCRDMGEHVNHTRRICVVRNLIIQISFSCVDVNMKNTTNTVLSEIHIRDLNDQLVGLDIRSEHNCRNCWVIRLTRNSQSKFPTFEHVLFRVIMTEVRENIRPATQSIKLVLIRDPLLESRSRRQRCVVSLNSELVARNFNERQLVAVVLTELKVKNISLQSLERINSWITSFISILIKHREST